MKFGKMINKQAKTLGNDEIKNLEDLQLWGMRKDLKKAVRFNKKLAKMGVLK